MIQLIVFSYNAFYLSYLVPIQSKFIYKLWVAHFNTYFKQTWHRKFTIFFFSSTMARASVSSARNTSHAMTKSSAPSKRKRDDTLQATGSDSDTVAPVSQSHTCKQSRCVNIDVDAEAEGTIHNTGLSMETIDNATDEEGEELIHENTAESKKAWEKKLSACCPFYLDSRSHNLLVKMRKKWTASAYDHFLPDVEITWNVRTKQWQ